MLKRSIPAGLNFTASGMPYWDTDIAGFFSPYIAANYHAPHTPLVDPSDAPRHCRELRRLSRVVCALVSMGSFPAGHARPRREKPQRGLVVWQTGRSHPGKISASALSTHAIHLLARLSGHTRQALRSCARSSWIFRATRMSPTSAMSTCLVRLSGCACYGTGGNQPQGLSARGLRLVQLLDQRTHQRRPDNHRECADRHHSTLCARGIDHSDWEARF